MKCKGKPHSSICDKATIALLSTSSFSVIYPVVIIETEGVKCNALIDRAGAYPINKESITAVDLHDFGDACIVTSCAVVYAVVNQPKRYLLVNLVSLKKPYHF